MLNTLRIESIRTAALRATLAALVLAASGVSEAASYELCATSGTATMPGTNQAVTVLGYATGACPASIAAPGGPILEATSGDVVTITLHNGLAESTGLVFQGQAMPPDLAGTANGVDKTYTFTATSPGTYLYQAAPLTNAEHQTAMGLYGALVVRPAGVAAPFSRTDANLATVLDSPVVADAAALASDVGASVTGPGIAAGTTILSVNVGVDMTLSAPATADGTGVSLVLSRTSGQAYAAASTAFDEERTMVLSEIDPALNNSATPATFDMRDYSPKYFLINGKAYPETLPIASAVGHKLLLRYVNAGSQHHSMATLGLRQNFIAKDGKVLPTADVAVTAETLAAGQTGDALVTMPAVLAAASQFAVYDGNLKLHNSSDQGIGGMLTFVTADAASTTAGPVTSAAKVAPNPTNGAVDVALTATISTTDAGGVSAAEYFIDAPCKSGTVGVAMAGGASPLAASATIGTTTLASLTSGNHTIYVHGQDANGWGACTSVVLNLDKTGPTTSALVLTPNPSSGSVPVTLTGSASDVASGGANVAAFEYWVDAGAHTSVTLTGTAAPVRSLSASLPAPGTGNHTVSVRSQDALGNWGAVATTVLTGTIGGPVTSELALLPSSANNGSYGVSSGQPVVRVRGREISSAAKVTAAEGFIDGASCPATTVRGFPFTPVDGAWGGANERITSDIPLATINKLAAGSHPIWVRGKDSTGAWGACVSTPLLIDKTAPTLTSGTLSPSTVPFGTASVTLNFVASDTGGAGIAGVQYWFDTATPPANPKVAAGTTSAVLSLAGIAGGSHTVYFRARDAANNVSTVRNASLTIVRAVDDARTIVASGAAGAQTSDTTTAQRVLANDLPAGGNPRTSVLVAGLTRTSGTGTATVTLSCPATLGTAGGAVGGSTICTNGAYRVTLTGVGTSNNARAASKRGTFQFTYQMNRSGALSNVATVTIRVQ